MARMIEDAFNFPDGLEIEKKNIIANIVDTVEESPVMVIVKELSTGEGYAATVSYGMFRTLAFGKTRAEVLERIDLHTGRYAGRERLILFSGVCPDCDPEDPEDELERVVFHDE